MTDEFPYYCPTAAEFKSPQTLTDLSKMMQRGIKNLRLFELSGPLKGDGGCSQVARKLNEYSTWLALSYFRCHVGEETLGVLGHRLRVNRTLKYLGLSNNKLPITGLKLLCEGLASNDTLETLILRNSGIDDDCIEVLAELFQKNTPLRYVNLAANGFTNKGAAVLIDGIEPNTNLIWLDASEMPQIDSEALTSIGVHCRRNHRRYKDKLDKVEEKLADVKYVKWQRSRIVFIGAYGTGKSSMIQKLVGAANTISAPSCTRDTIKELKISSTLVPTIKFKEGVGKPSLLPLWDLCSESFTEAAWHAFNSLDLTTPTRRLDKPKARKKLTYMTHHPRDSNDNLYLHHSETSSAPEAVDTDSDCISKSEDEIDFTFVPSPELDYHQEIGLKSLVAAESFQRRQGLDLDLVEWNLCNRSNLESFFLDRHTDMYVFVFDLKHFYKHTIYGGRSTIKLKKNYSPLDSKGFRESFRDFKMLQRLKSRHRNGSRPKLLLVGTSVESLNTLIKRASSGQSRIMVESAWDPDEGGTLLVKNKSTLPRNGTRASRRVTRSSRMISKSPSRYKKKSTARASDRMHKTLRKTSNKSFRNSLKGTRVSSGFTYLERRQHDKYEEKQANLESALSQVNKQLRTFFSQLEGFEMEDLIINETGMTDFVQSKDGGTPPLLFFPVENKHGIGNNSLREAIHLAFKHKSSPGGSFIDEIDTLPLPFLFFYDIFRDRVLKDASEVRIDGATHRSLYPSGCLTVSRIEQICKQSGYSKNAQIRELLTSLKSLGLIYGFEDTENLKQVFIIDPELFINSLSVAIDRTKLDIELEEVHKVGLLADYLLLRKTGIASFDMLEYIWGKDLVSFYIDFLGKAFLLNPLPVRSSEVLTKSQTTTEFFAITKLLPSNVSSKNVLKSCCFVEFKFKRDKLPPGFLERILYGNLCQGMSTSINITALLNNVGLLRSTEVPKCFFEGFAKLLHKDGSAAYFEETRAHDGYRIYVASESQAGEILDQNRSILHKVLTDDDHQLGNTDYEVWFQRKFDDCDDSDIDEDDMVSLEKAKEIELHPWFSMTRNNTFDPSSLDKFVNHCI